MRGCSYFGCWRTSPAPAAPARALRLRRHLCAGAGLHETVDNDAIVGADALLDDAQIVRGDLPERHVFMRAPDRGDHDRRYCRACSVPMAMSGTSSPS